MEEAIWTLTERNIGELLDLCRIRDYNQEAFLH